MTHHAPPLEPAQAIAWSVHVIDLATGHTRASENPQHCLSTASLGKIFALIELAERLTEDPSLAAIELDRTPALRVEDSGLWQSLTRPKLPLVDIAALIGATSDNWATNVLLDYLTLDAVQSRARDLAPHGSTLHDYVRDTRSPTDPPHLSTGCAQDYTHVLRQLWATRDQPTSRQVLHWLGLNTDLSLVAAPLHLDPLAHTQPDHGIQLWNKTGADARVRADAGIVTAAGGSGGQGTSVAYAAIANWPVDGYPARASAISRMHAIGEAIAQNLR